jgi:hypothetical protein
MLNATASLYKEIFSLSSLCCLLLNNRVIISQFSHFLNALSQLLFVCSDIRTTYTRYLRVFSFYKRSRFRISLQQFTRDYTCMLAAAEVKFV